MMKTFSSLNNFSLSAWFSASRIVKTAIVNFPIVCLTLCVNVSKKLALGRKWSLLCKFQCTFNDFTSCLLDGFEIFVNQYLRFFKAVFEKDDGIAFLVFCDLIPRTVVAGVRHRVAHVPVSANFE